MSSRVFEVFVGEQARKVGTLRFEAQGARQHSTFTYDAAWAQDADAFAISPTMPLAQGSFFTSKLREPHSLAFPGPIGDTCPDAWGRAIVTRDGSLKGMTLYDADLLACVGDPTRMGALRFKEHGAFVRDPGAGRPIAPAFLELEQLMAAARAFEAKSETERDVARLLGNGSSLGGARPKCNILMGDGRLAIAKFTSERDKLPVERAEVATLKLASACGLNVPDAEICIVADTAVALITRFDRGPKGRIPFISAQTMLDHSEAVDGTYEEMIEAIRTDCRDAASQTRELFGRVAFTILVNNTDDHLRNHGFIYAGCGRWMLSPAFDINPFPGRDRRLKTRIAGDVGDDASLDLLVSRSAIFGLQAAEAKNVISAMAKTVSDGWARHAKAAGMSKKEIDAYAPAFEHPELRTYLPTRKSSEMTKAPVRKQGRGLD